LIHIIEGFVDFLWVDFYAFVVDSVRNLIDEFESFENAYLVLIVSISFFLFLIFDEQLQVVNINHLISIQIEFLLLSNLIVQKTRDEGSIEFPLLFIFCFFHQGNLSRHLGWILKEIWVILTMERLCHHFLWKLFLPISTSIYFNFILVFDHEKGEIKWFKSSKLDMELLAWIIMVLQGMWLTIHFVVKLSLFLGRLLVFLFSEWFLMQNIFVLLPFLTIITGVHEDAWSFL